MGHQEATTSGRFSGKRGAITIISVVTLTSLILLAMAEGAVRLRQWMRYGTASSHESLYSVDKASGLRVLHPGFTTERITINSLGFRGPEIPRVKPAGVVRIAFLGASTTFCAEVSSDAAVWTAGVVVRLKQRFPHADFDYINAGIPGYSVQSSRVHYERYVKPLDPDAVMIYHATNDMSGELRALAAREGLWKAETQTQRSLSETFLLWELIDKNLRVMRAQSANERPSGRLIADRSRLGHQFRVDLDQLIASLQISTRHISVATFSTRLRKGQSLEEKKQAAVSALVYMPFMTLDGLIEAYDRYNEMIRASAHNGGVLLIGEEHSIPADAAHFVDSVHFTDQGSALMAIRVADALAADERFRAIVEARASMR